MTYYDSESLKDKIESSEAGVDVGEALDIVNQIARGLTRAHSKEIVHHDVKFANIGNYPLNIQPKKQPGCPLTDGRRACFCISIFLRAINGN